MKTYALKVDSNGVTVVTRDDFGTTAITSPLPGINEALIAAVLAIGEPIIIPLVTAP